MIAKPIPCTGRTQLELLTLSDWVGKRDQVNSASDALQQPFISVIFSPDNTLRILEVEDEVPSNRFANYRNLMITMLLGGLWHGANWTFVAWGAYHGLLLSLHRMLREPAARIPGAIRRVVTFFLVVVGWVFFRSPTFRAATVMLRGRAREGRRAGA